MGSELNEEGSNSRMRTPSRKDVETGPSQMCGRTLRVQIIKQDNENLVFLLRV